MEVLKSVVKNGRKTMNPKVIELLAIMDNALLANAELRPQSVEQEGVRQGQGQGQRAASSSSSSSSSVTSSSTTTASTSANSPRLVQNNGEVCVPPCRRSSMQESEETDTETEPQPEEEPTASYAYYSGDSDLPTTVPVSPQSSVTSLSSEIQSGTESCTASPLRTQLSERLRAYERKRNEETETPIPINRKNDIPTTNNNNNASPLAKLVEDYEAKRNAEVVQRNSMEAKSSTKATTTAAIFYREKVSPEIERQRNALPIFSKKDDLMKLMKENQVVIVVGETGSGKSTQIPQYVADAGLAGKGMIGITQPRRVAAKSLAMRVAEECGVQLGTSVGYSVRFDSNISSKTVIKYLTDGMLVKECLLDPRLEAYSVIMIDEAHERSNDTDVCFGLLKRAIAKRSDLKIVISSATLEDEKFSKFFNDAPVFYVTGSSFEVKLVYQPPLPGRDFYVNHHLFLEDILVTVLTIHTEAIVNKEEGDILVFLTGQDEIEILCEKFAEVMAKSPYVKLDVVPCHGSLPLEGQQKMLDKSADGFRKIVLATNIAETSITIDGIVFVVDCGYVKERRYNSRTRIESLVRIPITQFQAIQRQGRAGRTRPGVCYRLYSEDTYNRFKKAQEPDIRRSNVDSVVLELLAMGIKDPLKFEFIDAPPEEAIMESLCSLRDLSAVDKNIALTDLGRQMAGFPLDPPLAKVLITSAKLGCTIEVLKITAMLSIQYQHLFCKSRDTRAKANSRMRDFFDYEGDHLALLRVYNSWESNKYSEEWCQENFLQFRYLKEARDVHGQLTEIMLKSQLMPMTKKAQIQARCDRSKLKENIGKAFSAGYFYHLAKRQGTKNVYMKISPSGDKKSVYLSPSSALFKTKPDWIIFHEVLETTKAFVHCAIGIEPQWIKEYAPGFVKDVEEKYRIKF